MASFVKEIPHLAEDYGIVVATVGLCFMFIDDISLEIHPKQQ